MESHFTTPYSRGTFTFSLWHLADWNDKKYKDTSEVEEILVAKAWYPQFSLDEYDEYVLQNMVSFPGRVGETNGEFDWGQVLSEVRRVSERYFIFFS